MEAYVIPAIILGAIGLLAAAILYWVSRRFAVVEDERIAQIEAILPGANCGACGMKGCHDFAAECCKRGNLDGLRCPGAGDDGMQKIAQVLGLSIESSISMVATIRCNGTCDNRIGQRQYGGMQSCRLVRASAVTDDVCQWGCIGCGDCVAACRFGAIKIGNSGIAVVDRDLCTGCGVCVATCPQKLIELRRGDADAVWVSCVNRDKGAMARKQCRVACIGCGKCAKVCPVGAASVGNNVATINGERCTACGTCVAACPMHAITARRQETEQTTITPINDETEQAKDI